MVFVSIFGADYYFAPAPSAAAAVVSAFDDTIWAWLEQEKTEQEKEKLEEEWALQDIQKDVACG